VKHRFLLDFNIIYHAVRGVDEHDEPDTTCAELLLLIGRNCHTIVVNSYLFQEYLARLNELFGTKAPALPPIYFLLQLLLKAEKFSQETEELPPIPQGIEIPHEVFVERLSIGDRIAVIIDRLRSNDGVAFTSLFDDLAVADRHRLVPTFLAVLEMARLKLIKVHQLERHSEIYLSRTEALVDGGAEGAGLDYRG